MDLEEFLFMLVVSVNIYHIRNLSWYIKKHLFSNNSNKSLESLNNINGNKSCQFSLKWKAHFTYFSEKYLPNIQVWITVFCLWLILSSKNGVWGRKQLVQHTIQLFKCFPWRQPLCFGMQLKSLFVHPISSQNIKKPQMSGFYQ